VFPADSICSSSSASRGILDCKLAADELGDDVEAETSRDEEENGEKPSREPGPIDRRKLNNLDSLLSDPELLSGEVMSLSADLRMLHVLEEAPTSLSFSLSERVLTKFSALNSS